jgi:hypothetical protein
MSGYLILSCIQNQNVNRAYSRSLTYEHLQNKGLYPCGEGAGYAGGIISAISMAKMLLIGAILNQNNRNRNLGFLKDFPALK